MTVSASMREVNRRRDDVIEMARSLVCGLDVGRDVGTDSLYHGVKRLEDAERRHAENVPHAGTDTSKAAALKLPEPGSWRSAIISILQNHGAKPDRAIHWHLPMASESTVRAARNHLLNVGLVTDSGERWVDPTDPLENEHIMWRLTEYAHQLIKEEARGE